MRILIGIPSYDRRVDLEVAKGLVLLERNGYDFDLVFPVSSHISRNRNYCVHQMLRENYDWLLFWDSDIGLEEGFLDKMLADGFKHDASIICGCYKIKDSQGKYVLGRCKEDGTYENIEEITETEEIDAGGTGCMLVKREVFEKLSDPWYTIVDKENLETMPEDFEFCRKAKNKGFKIIAVPTFNTYHYGYKAWEHLSNNI